jgi:hypothetical protein
MCEFISWKEYHGKIYFLTADQIFNTPRGKELQAHTSREDWVGHGAIAFYYNLPEGELVRNCECTDFSTPDNFPEVIAAAIRNGEFRGLGTPEGLLSKPAWAEYEKVRQPAWAEYEKVQQPALAEYEKVQQAALAEYEKVQQAAWAEYEKVQQPALAEYLKVRQAAWAEYLKVRQPALAEYQKVQQPAFWDSFAKKKNRNPNWK